MTTKQANPTQIFQKAMKDILQGDMHQDNVIAKKSGEIEIKRSYFYRHGNSPEKMGKRFEREIPFCRVTDTEDRWAAWPKTSYFVARFELRSEFSHMSYDELMQSFRDRQAELNAELEAQREAEREARRIELEKARAEEEAQRAEREAKRAEEARLQSEEDMEWFSRVFGMNSGDVVEVCLKTWEGYKPTLISINRRTEKAIVELQGRKGPKQYTVNLYNLSKSVKE